MPVSKDAQSAISQRYAQLSNAVTHDPTQERGILSPHFNGTAKMRISTFDYDPLTVIVQRIESRPDGLYVHAEYMSASMATMKTVGHWQMVGGQWAFAARPNP